MSKHLLGTLLPIQPEELCSAFAARAAKILLASSQVGRAQIATLAHCTDAPLFGTELEAVSAILQAQAKPPLQLAYQHSFLPLAMAFEAPHVGQLLLRDALLGPDHQAVKLLRASLHAFILKPGVCRSCLREQLQSLGMGIWLRQGMLLGWEMCLIHQEPIQRLCPDCARTDRARRLPLAPSARCLCGKSLRVDRHVAARESEWLEVAKDLQAVLAADPMRVNGPALQSLICQHGRSLASCDTAPGHCSCHREPDADLGAGNRLHLRGAGETSRARVVHGHGLSGSPLVNIMALRTLFGSARAALALLPVAGAASDPGKLPAAALQQTLTPDAERLALDQAMALALKARAPHLRLSDLELAWRDELTYLTLFASPWLTANFSSTERRQARWEVTDARYAQHVHDKAAALHRDLHAPPITMKLLLEGVVRYATYTTQRARLPKLVAALEAEAESGEAWKRRHLLIKLTDHPALATGALDLSSSEIDALTPTQLESKLIWITRRIREANTERGARKGAATPSQKSPARAGHGRR
ncbi:hypothetical protein RN01_12875 [Cupriavidus sp. SHE]|jgi:hypothetical protein|uniref:Uncharacterized protein n=1 Tax=Cupriavidus metallidurans TaxID=119219 RepID=A0A482J358_9BURK|nr:MULTISPECIES: hypothetical protein [Cupriavidus]KWR82369.1 hypothetical protein RN01_12875 [Cupriavidus sp. SHE]QBP13524.1 hypothetical protein DDF84_028405 [Cupriavidus metallidurans]